MKRRQIVESWDKIKPDDVAKDRMIAHIVERAENEKREDKKHLLRTKLLLTVACLASVLTVVVLTLNNGKSDFKLTFSTGNVDVRYVERAPSVQTESQLSYLTEEEIFYKYNTDIFRGTIEDIRNVVIDFNGQKEYKAIAQIKIDKVYRGDIAMGDTTSILLPCPVNVDNMWVEDTEVVSAMRTGMKGIFMPVKYDKTFYEEQNGTKFYPMDIAQYGLMDGERFAFIDTGNGLIFARDAYKSIETADSLEECESYIESMIK